MREHFDETGTPGWEPSWLGILARHHQVLQQTVVDGSKVDDHREQIARGYGSATLESLRADGNPRIAGNIKGIPLLRVLHELCGRRRPARIINFYVAGFANIKPTMDAANSWNRDKAKQRLSAIRN